MADGMRAGMVLEKELQAAGSKEKLCWTSEISEPIPPVTYFLRRGNTFHDKAMPLNSVLPMSQEFKQMNLRGHTY